MHVRSWSGAAVLFSLCAILFFARPASAQVIVLVYDAIEQERAYDELVAEGVQDIDIHDVLDRVEANRMRALERERAKRAREFRAGLIKAVRSGSLEHVQDYIVDSYMDGHEAAFRLISRGSFGLSFDPRHEGPLWPPPNSSAADLVSSGGGQ